MPQFVQCNLSHFVFWIIKSRSIEKSRMGNPLTSVSSASYAVRVLAVMPEMATQTAHANDSTHSLVWSWEIGVYCDRSLTPSTSRYFPVVVVVGGSCCCRASAVSCSWPELPPPTLVNPSIDKMQDCHWFVCMFHTKFHTKFVSSFKMQECPWIVCMSHPGFSILFLISNF
jgi:hypothetical protein